ncbi:MAG TPA: hypothetical protein VM261_20495 [Kofleriaceae bacterium]|nr:hypothetical protein [Kofleriaceae bacterium]
MRLARFRHRLTLLGILLGLGGAAIGCADDGTGDTRDIDDEWGMEGPLEPVPAPGKEDSEYRKGLLVATNTTRTQVWSAKNAWDDIDTTAARTAGLAWSANSGLTWDQKYSAWLDSMEFVPAADGYSQTIKLTTPWGRSFDSPSLECAEMSIFLRITFSAWYELPFFMESMDSTGKRVYFGHNGVRTANGRYASSPEFGVAYADHSKKPAAEYMASWPKDNSLRTKKLAGGEDTQPVFNNAPFGTYLDEIHLNKRAAYFTVMALNYLGSMNLADTANTYNLVPEAVRAGDTLVERWQKNGIGHTLVVKEVLPIGEGNLDVVTISGSMPRRQGKRESGVASKGYFTSNYTGGVGMSSDGVDYAKLGGGLKRWRVAKNVGGYWTNTWMRGDEASWINSTDYARIGARPARFQSLLGQVSPQQQKTELLAQIEDSRRHLRNYPASCSARERREGAFAELYSLSQRAWGTSQAEIDRMYRKDEDYVLAELDYTRSKTCCWNSSTTAMYEIVMAEANAEIAAAEAAGTCAAPTVFMNQSNGYARWQARAQQMGQASAWKAWSEDEACAQRDVAADTVAAVDQTAFCALESGGGGGGCTDRFEPNDSRGTAKAVAVGSQADLRICTGDRDWFSSSTARTVRIAFRHADGDLDLTAYDSAGNRVGQSAGTGDTEQVMVPAGGTVEVLGYNGATGGYTLTVQ